MLFVVREVLIGKKLCSLWTQFRYERSLVIATIIVCLYLKYLHFTLFTTLLRQKKLEKLPKLEISEQSVIGVRFGKSGPQERPWLANQIQGFRFQTAKILEKRKGLTRPNVFFLGSLNGLLGEICGTVTEYCRINCCVCTFLLTPAQEAALLKKIQWKINSYTVISRYIPYLLQ